MEKVDTFQLYLCTNMDCPIPQRSYEEVYSKLPGLYCRSLAPSPLNMLRTVARRAFTPSLRRFSTQIREPGPVGLFAGDDPRATLVQLYKQTLGALKEIPETATYRVNVEKITNYRMGIVSENEEIAKIEETLNIGQIQEVIEQAEDELKLIPHMIEWKPWEMKDGEKPVVITVVD